MAQPCNGNEFTKGEPILRVPINDAGGVQRASLKGIMRVTKVTVANLTDDSVGLAIWTLRA